MAGNGGKRPGAGRPKGKQSKRTIGRQMIERDAATAQAVSGESPLQFMLRMMRDQDNGPLMRLDAAKSVSPYLHPRLAHVQVTNTNIGDMSDDELHELLADIKAIKGRG